MYEAGNHLLVCAEYSDPELHKHNAAHIMISLDDEIEVITKNEKKRCRGIAIPSGMAHTANTNKNKVLVFLFDNTTSIANHIKNLTLLSDKIAEKVVEAYYYFEKSNKSKNSYHAFMKHVYQCVNLRIAENIVKALI